MADLITVSKRYLDTLIRRAALHSDSNLETGDTVLVSKTEYSSLQRTQREYYILRHALVRGGLTLDTLNTLLQGDPDQSEGYEHVDTWGLSSAVDEATDVTGQLGRFVVSSYPKQAAITITEIDSERPSGLFRQGSGEFPRVKAAYLHKASGAISSVLEADDDFLGGLTDTHASKAQLPRADQRTILVSNLSDRTTHQELVQLIRGGRLLDLHLRSDRTAAVSFVEGAADFLAYTKRQDFYLHGKRLEFRWSERQFHMPNHVANKIANGATRNIVIRAKTVRPGQTPQEPLSERSLRDDLEHIHNLEVVSVTFKEGDCYISTNSVHNALFARTCMMSRARYKGMRIEWYPDECALPVPQMERNRRSPLWNARGKPAAAQQPARTELANRFGVLDMAETDESSSSEPELPASMGVEAWADEGFSV